MTSVRLQNNVASAEIALRGAELRDWIVDGAPLIWSKDPAVWAETAPILFPVVGWTRGHRIIVDGASHPLGLHGFARTLDFEVIGQWPTHVGLCLRSSPETRALYPFDWSLKVDVELQDRSLAFRFAVTNDGGRVMPYACGFHPGFRWPFAGGSSEDYSILFGEREGSSVPMISPDGLFMRQERKVPLDGRSLDLSDALFSKEALCFLNARSRSVRFAHRSGTAIDMSVEDFPHLALWSRPGGRFLCIEAWTGHGDYVDADGDLFKKDSMRHLAPGQIARHAVTLSYSPPHRPVLRG